MSRKELSLSAEKIQSFDLENLQKKAVEMNQRHMETRTIPFSKDPGRWLSHYQFEPGSIELTSQGEVDGKMSWLMGSNW